MKIVCQCGADIPDGGDAAPHKAWLLAEQDLFAATERDEAVGLRDAVADLMRPVRRCHACGRICFTDPVTGEFVWYAPEIDPRGRPLGSVLGNAYPVALRGEWRAHADPPHGELFWGTSGDREGGHERLDDWDRLERRYLDVEAMLKRERRLREATLRRGDRVIRRSPA